MRDVFLELLKKLVGKKVRLNFYIPAGASIVDEKEVTCFSGSIEDIAVNEDSGWLRFRHNPYFAEAAKFHISYINLNGCVIFQVDEFPDDYDWIDYREQLET